MAMEFRRPATAFSLDTGRKGQGGRLKAPKHLNFIRALPCLASGSTIRIEAAHIRYADPAHGKPGTPMGRKPDDCYVVPLSAHAHREGPNAQHGGNEREWWEALRIDPIAIALALYAITGDEDAGNEIIWQASRGRAPWINRRP